MEADQNQADPTHWIDNILASAHAHHLGNKEGALADYNSELVAVEPERFGIALATVTGKLHAVGDTEFAFHDPVGLQSLRLLHGAGAGGPRSRARTRRRRAERRCLQRDHFRSAYELAVQPDDHSGAITVAGIIHDIAGWGAFYLILHRLSEAAGRPLLMDEAVYRSELETGHRNRAIGHLLRAAGALRW